MNGGLELVVIAHGDWTGSTLVLIEEKKRMSSIDDKTTHTKGFRDCYITKSILL